MRRYLLKQKMGKNRKTLGYFGIHEISKYLFTFGFVLALFLSVALYAQKYSINFDRLSIEDGLSQNVVYSIIQDGNGFMWFGTQEGLNKYDGYRFKIFRHDFKNPNSLSNNLVMAICEDKDGILWIGTEGGGLDKFNPETEQFIHYTHKTNDPNCLSDNSINSIYIDKTGTLWIGTGNGGLNRFDPKKEQFTHLKNDPDNPASLSHNRIRSIIEDRSGFLWIGTEGGGLNRLDREKMLFSHYKHDPKNKNTISHDKVISIYEDSSGFLWIGTDGGGLNKFDSQNGRFFHYKHDPRETNSLNHNRIWSIYESRTGILWIGTYGGGLDKFIKGSEQFIHYTHNPNEPKSLSNNYIRTMYEDQVGVLWIGLSGGGLNKYHKKKDKFIHYKHNPNDPNSLSHNNVWAIYEDKDGFIWVATYGGGLNRFDRRREKFVFYKNNRSDPNSISRNEILSILEDSQGVLWIGTDGGGLDRFVRGKNHFINYRHNPRDSNSLSNDEVMALCEDMSGVLWIGTNGGGLNRLDKERKRFTRFKNDPDNPKSISHNEVLDIFEDGHGAIWIGTDGGGLNQFDAEKGEFIHFKHDPDNPSSLSNNFVMCIYEDKSGVMWIGTYGGGLNQFSRERKIFLCYTEKDGLANDNIYGIAEDGQGNLWISTNGGLSKFSPETESFKNYDIKDGLQSNEFNQGAYFKNRKGEIFFGGLVGFNAFYPEKVKDNPHIPPIVLTAFRIFEKEKKLSDFISKKKNSIKLSHKQNFFSFDFAALDYTAPENNKYAYKMDGLVDEWIQCGTRRFASFTNVNPGTYVFRVKGSNNDGIWNQEGISLIIHVIPPFWKTWWFTLLSVVFFAFISYLTIHFFRKYLTLITFWKKKNIISHYRIIEQIGSGGMGTVYKACDLTNSTNIVAIKVIKEEMVSDPTLRRRFINEALIVDQLDHPNIVKVMERGEQDKRLFIAMELLEGYSLADMIKREEKISIEEGLKIILQLADAISRIHSKNIVHRDLKPENVMLVEKGQSKRFVKLLDFGLAKTQGITRLTESGMVIGTINYLSPEQISRASSSFSSDMYSIGIIFYELLTHEKPFVGETTVDIMKQILKKKPIEPSKFRPDISKDLNDIIMKLIDKSPYKRPIAKDLKVSIESFLGLTIETSGFIP